jgi:predicted Zn-dependent peptidase
MTKKIKIIAFLVAMALISTPIFMRKEHKPLEVRGISSKMNIKTSLIQINSDDIVYIKCVFKNAGVLHNSVSKHGISLLAAHMLFDKIGDLTQEETTEKLLDLEIRYLNVIAEEDDLSFSFFVTQNKIVDALKFIAMAFSDRQFSSADLERVKCMYPVVLDTETASPYDLLLDKTLNLLYEASVYGMSPTGSSQSIAGITVKDIKEFIADVLKRDNLEVTFAGKVSPFDIDGYLEILFAGISADEKEIDKDAMGRKLSASMSSEPVALITRPSMGNVVGVMIAARLDDMTDLEEAAAYIIMNTIFDKKMGDFVRELRSNNIIYNVSTSYLDRSLSKVFYWTAYIDKNDLPKYLKYTSRKIQEYSAKIDVGELKKTQKFFQKVSADGFDSLDDLDAKIKKASLPFGDVTDMLLQETAKKLFDLSRLKTVIIGDLKTLPIKA